MQYQLLWALFGDWMWPLDFTDGQQSWLSAALQVSYLIWISIVLLNMLIVRGRTATGTAHSFAHAHRDVVDCVFLRAGHDG